MNKKKRKKSTVWRLLELETCREPNTGARIEAAKDGKQQRRMASSNEGWRAAASSNEGRREGWRAATKDGEQQRRTTRRMASSGEGWRAETASDVRQRTRELLPLRSDCPTASQRTLTPTIRLCAESAIWRRNQNTGARIVRQRTGKLLHHLFHSAEYNRQQCALQNGCVCTAPVIGRSIS